MHLDDKKVSAFKEYHDKWGILPSLKDLCLIFKFKSRTSAWKLRELMVEKEFLGKNPNYYPTEKFLTYK